MVSAEMSLHTIRHWGVGAQTDRQNYLQCTKTHILEVGKVQEVKTGEWTLNNEDVNNYGTPLQKLKIQQH